MRRSLAALILGALLVACGTASDASQSLDTSSAPASAVGSVAPSQPEPPTPEPTPTPEPIGGVYAATVSGEIDPSLADVPERVWVPNEESNDVAIVDPETLEVVGRIPVDAAPEHVSPDWEMEHLYVANMNGGTLTVIDPRQERAIDTIDLPIFPYALYYTLDGSKVMVVTNYISINDVADNGVHFYDPDTWELIKYVQVPWPGADDADLSADGRYLWISAEYTGMVVRIDTETMELAGAVDVDSLPRDVRLSPDGSVVFTTNEGLGGIQVIDPEAMEVTQFIPTGEGTHGIEFSRDTRLMYVANRAAGTITVIDLATLEVVDDWAVGGSPDEMVLNPDGSRLWASNRYHGTVSVIDTATGELVGTVATGANPHGLTYWPQPGRHPVGQNGNMR